MLCAGGAFSLAAHFDGKCRAHGASRYIRRAHTYTHTPAASCTHSPLPSMGISAITGKIPFQSCSRCTSYEVLPDQAANVFKIAVLNIIWSRAIQRAKGSLKTNFLGDFGKIYLPPPSPLEPLGKSIQYSIILFTNNASISALYPPSPLPGVDSFPT